jgi:mannosyltransferase
MIVLFGWEANGTLYSIVLWPLIRLFGDGEQLLRAPSVLAGVAAVPAMWWAARQFGLRRAGALGAAALLAVNPMAVWYSQEARAYAFVVLGACLSFGALARAVREPDSRWAWVLYVVAMAAMAYSDLLAAPCALLAQALLVWRSAPEQRWRWLRALLWLIACCLPLLVAAVISRSRRDAFYWLPKTDRALVESTLQEFTGGFSGVSAVGWLTLLLVAALVLGAAWRLRGSAGGVWEGRRTGLLVAGVWGLAPAVLLLAVSFVEPVFWPRYAILSLPGLALLIALAAECVWEMPAGPAAALACTAALVGLGLFASIRQRGEIQENWRPVAAWLRSERTSAQPVVVDNALVLPSLGYYDPAFRAPDGDLVVQEWRDRPLPAGFIGYKDRTGYGSVPNGPPSAATFAQLARRGHGTVWMVVSEADPNLQSDPRSGAAVAWARAHCDVEVRSSIGVWALRASGCAQAAG